MRNNPNIGKRLEIISKCSDQNIKTRVNLMKNTNSNSQTENKQKINKIE